MTGFRDTADPGFDRELERTLRRIRKRGSHKDRDGHHHGPKSIKRVRRIRRHIDTVLDEDRDYSTY